MHAGLDGQAAFGQRGAEKLCVFLKLVAQFGRRAEKLERFEGSSNNRWRDCVGKQVWSRPLPQKVDNFLSPAGEAATGAAESLSKRAGDDIDPAHHAAIFVRAASSFAEKTGGVRVVDHRQRVVLFGEVTNGR